MLLALTILCLILPQTISAFACVPGTKPVLLGRTTPTKVMICYDQWQYMLMPWMTANPIAGFNINEAGKYTIQAWQGAELVWESPLLIVWNEVNLIYYVGGARFSGEPITFILMNSGVAVVTYMAP